MVRKLKWGGHGTPGPPSPVATPLKECELGRFTLYSSQTEFVRESISFLKKNGKLVPGFLQQQPLQYLFLPNLTEPPSSTSHIDAIFNIIQFKDQVLKESQGSKLIKLVNKANDKQKQAPDVFYKKGFLKNYTKFTEKHLCRSLRPPTLLKKRL